MNLLYLGKYRSRFTQVIEQIKNLPPNSKILELCFGDTYIAAYSKNAGYKWNGIDLNKHFVKQAQKMGYDADYKDLVSLEALPKADACVMVGSFYHFQSDAFSILKKMFSASGLVVISEPVSNLSSKGGLVGFIAKRAANAGNGNEEFRYNEKSFLSMLKENSAPLSYTISSVKRFDKDLIVKLIKNGNN